MFGFQPNNKGDSCPSEGELQQWLAATETCRPLVHLGDHISHCRACQARLDLLTESRELSSFRASGFTRVTSPALDRVVMSLLDVAPSSSKLPANASTHNNILTEVALPSQQREPSLKTASESTELGERLPLRQRYGDAQLFEETKRPEKVGSYQILRKIGQGGMGVVYLARDPRLQRTIALKRLSSATGEKRARFEREARAIAQLQHEHVVRLLSWEYDTDGTPFLTMEYVDGVNLSQRIHDRKDVNVAESVNYVVQVASGLALAHQVGILHRDIKPGNILIASSGLAKLADFSLAQFTETSLSQITQAGVIVGTPAYMSPEQARGDSLDSRSDIYSLGCVLYECLTGVPPFQGTQIQILRQVLETDPRPVRQLNERIPLELEIICQKAMASTRENRYEEVGEFSADLRRFQAGEPIHARPASWSSRALKWVRRNPWQTAAASISLVGLCGALAGALLIRSANHKLQLSYAKLSDTNGRLVKAEQDAQTSFNLTRELLVRIVDRMQNDLFQVPQADKLAIESVRDSAELHRRLSELRPMDPQLAVDYLDSLKNLWYTEWIYQNHEQEAHALSEYQQKAELLCEKFPDQVEIRALYADLLTDLAIEEEKKGNRHGANAWSQKAQTQLTRLQELAPYTMRISKLAWKIAYQEYRQSQERSASTEDQLAAASKLVACCEQCVNVASAQELDGESQMLCDNLCRLAEIQTAAKRLSEAETNLDRVHAMCEKLQEVGEPRMWRMVKARLHSCRSDLAIERNDVSTARTALAIALGECRALRSEYPDDPGIRRRLAQVLYRVAKTEYEHGDKQRAQGPMEEAVGILESLDDEGLSRDNATELLEKLKALEQEMKLTSDRPR